MTDSNILIIAAEDSSAEYAAEFISYWKSASYPKLHFWGIGSSRMQSLGFENLSDTQDMAVVGLVEVIQHYSRLKIIFNQILQQCEEHKPKLAILMDYPGFNLKLAKELKLRGITVIYWIPPQVWAWRKSRVTQIKQYVDDVISVFPFEHTFYLEHGIRSHFFGHPLTDQIQPEFFNLESRNQRRLKSGIAPDKFVVGLMPGSRMSEIERHLDIQLQVATRIYKKFPGAVFLIPVAPSRSVEDIKSRIHFSSVPLIVQQRDPRLMIDLMDVAVVASGTATLLVALMEKPMVIMYKMNAFTAFLLRRLVKGVHFFGLPNLVANKKIVPELFQEQASVDQIEEHLLKLIGSMQDQEVVKKDLSALRQSMMNQSGVIKKTAEFICDKLGLKI